LAPPSSVRARWATRLALISYVGLLATSVLAPGGRAGVAGAGFLDLRTGSRVRAVVVALAVYVLLETVRFLPVGVLAVLSLPRTRSDRFRMLPVAAAAGAGSLLIAGVVLVLEIGPPWNRGHLASVFSGQLTSALTQAGGHSHVGRASRRGDP
jgi:hypothetical protein